MSWIVSVARFNRPCRGVRKACLWSTWHEFDYGKVEVCAPAYRCHFRSNRFAKGTPTKHIYEGRRGDLMSMTPYMYVDVAYLGVFWAEIRNLRV